MNDVYVVGGAQTDFERNFKKEGKGIIAIIKEVVEDSMLSTGITFEMIDQLNETDRIACFLGNFAGDSYCNQGHIGALLTEVSNHFYGIPSARYEAACASSSIALDAAITKIKAGEIDLALVLGVELMKTVDSRICGDFLGRAALYDKEARGIDFPFPKLFGQLASETIEKYQLDSKQYYDDLAKIATINYKNAKRNSKAQTRKWFVNYNQASNRGTSTNPLVGGNMAVTDCSQVTDGAVAVFLCSDKFKLCRDRDLKIPKVIGVGNTVAPMQFSKKIEHSKNDDFILPYTRKAVEKAYHSANVTIEDIDFIETHDCFTSSEYVAISAFGITKPGEEHTAIDTGIIDFDGRIPINPSGGLIGCGHPVGASGTRMFLDLYNQLTNNAGDYQVKDAKIGAMLNIGGSATTNCVFIMENK